MGSTVVASASTDNPIGQWLVLGWVSFLVLVLVYAFLTRYRADWDGLLRTWTREQQTTRERQTTREQQTREPDEDRREDGP